MPWQQPRPTGSFSGLTQCFLGLKEFAENSEFCNSVRLVYRDSRGGLAFPLVLIFCPTLGQLHCQAAKTMASNVLHPHSPF